MGMEVCVTETASLLRLPLMIAGARTTLSRLLRRVVVVVAAGVEVATVVAMIVAARHAAGARWPDESMSGGNEPCRQVHSGRQCVL